MELIALFGVLFWVMIFIAYILLLSAVYKYAKKIGTRTNYMGGSFTVL